MAMSHRHSETVRFRFSPMSRLGDIRALLDSYGVEVWMEGLLYLRAPLHFCELASGEAAASGLAFPAVDKKIDLRLCRFEPPAEDFLEGIRERSTRWPFFVNDPLEVVLYLGDQWWVYKFTPSRFYEERRIV